MSGRVREATVEDLSALRAIQLVSLAEPWPELLGVAVGGPPILLVYADPRPVGYALALVGGAGPDATDADVSSTGNGESDCDAYLVELAVAAPRRGEGCGSALLSALETRLRREGCERLRTTVRDVDERAIGFYRDRGFTVEARLPDHYGSGDGRLLVRRLDS